MKRTKKNPRRATFLGSDGNVVLEGVPEPVEDPLLKTFERKRAVHLSPELVEAAFAEADRVVSRAGKKPTGTCHTCGRAIGPMRLYCGPCLAKRM